MQLINDNWLLNGRLPLFRLSMSAGWLSARLAWRASSSSGDHVNGPELQTADCDINNDVDWPGHGADRVPMIHIWQNNLSIAMNSSGINAWKIILDEDGPICGITLVLPSLNRQQIGSD